MIFRRNQQPPEPAPQAEAPLGTLRIACYWSDYLGDAYYALEKYGEAYVGYAWFAKADGDVAWAERVAKRYGLELPDMMPQASAPLFTLPKPNPTRTIRRGL